MKVTNMCKKMRRDEIIAFNKYAKRLNATEMVIHNDGSVDLFEDGNCICENYKPSAKELYKKNDEISFEEMLTYDREVII